ncbi:oxidoreductase [Inquilinus sp. KBS0705]|nr:oxidoreductase [Inquilinus sp. KBS0705]
MKTKHLLFIALILISSAVKAQSIIPLAQARPTSIRGLSIVDDSVAWVSGSKGTIGITSNGGKNWIWSQVKDHEKAEFRDIEAFSDKEAVIMASGTPAVVLKTIDGGLTWQQTYHMADSAYFLDAMDFADAKHGWILGDPINGKLLLLQTIDGGETWQQPANAPVALQGEASFAASGTCLRVNKNTITIVTGGGNSRILSSPTKALYWTATVLPLTNGKQSMGAFSFAWGKNQTIIAGGDYAKDTRTDSVAYLLPNKNALYKGNTPLKGPAGFQSCVEYVWGDTYLATGTSGSNLTTDGGKTWQKIDAASYNVCRKAKHGKLILLAGDRGKLGLFKM